MTDLLHIFIGYDDREKDAYDVCVDSLRAHSRSPIQIHKLDQDALRRQGAYIRPKDEPASTQFAFTRFLVPHLMGFKGRALFVDCDFLFTQDVTDLFHSAPWAAAVSVVKHDYTPKAKWKMEGQPQVAYPRKNWSSLMLFRCGSVAARKLDVPYVNSAPAPDLHRLAWAHDSEIGALPDEWNWLEGEYQWERDVPPAGIHFTNGGPWHTDPRAIRFGNLWTDQLKAIKR